MLTQLREGEEPFAPAPKGIRPEWFFVWMFQTLKIVPAHVWIFEGERVAILGFGLLLVLIAAVPLLEARSSSVRPSASGWFTMLGWILLLYVFVMTLSGYLETPVFASTLQEAAPDELFKSDIHNQRGITCGDCHKDNPQPEKREVAALCARCHSDLNYMRRFNPQMRVDQFAEYQTSVHGMRNARGDENVATWLTNPAMTMTAAAHKNADRALEEVGFRRRGLGYALIAIAVTMIGLLLKIREIESR